MWMNVQAEVRHFYISLYNVNLQLVQFFLLGSFDEVTNRLFLP